MDSKIDIYYTLWYKGIMDIYSKEFFSSNGKKGAKITNAKLTKEKRSKAAKKAWKKRRIIAKLKHI